MEDYTKGKKRTLAFYVDDAKKRKEKRRNDETAGPLREGRGIGMKKKLGLRRRLKGGGKLDRTTSWFSPPGVGIMKEEWGRTAAKTVSSEW